MGINNFLLRPIQQLPKYKLLLNEIIKELSNDILLNKQEIAILVIAENTVLRLLDLVNESMNINHIKNCNEVMSCEYDNSFELKKNINNYYHL